MCMIHCHLQNEKCNRKCFNIAIDICAKLIPWFSLNGELMMEFANFTLFNILERSLGQDPQFQIFCEFEVIQDKG